MGSVRLGLFSILILFVGYQLYAVPVPEGVAQPLQLRIMFALNELFISFAQWLEYVGVATEVGCLRWGMETMAGLMNSLMPPEGVDTVDTMFSGVAVRVYTPRGDSPVRAGMVYYHGGGWVLGSVDTHHATTGYFAKHSDLVVVSVNYRLSPENSKLDGFDDCVTATRYFIDNAAMFGVDPERVVIAGDSGGAVYVATVALYLRDTDFKSMPKIQMMIYPAVQVIDVQLPSYQQNRYGPALTMHLTCLMRSMVYAKSTKYMPYYDTNTHVPSDVRVAMSTGILNHDIIPEVNKYAPYVKPNYQEGGSDIWEFIKDDVFDSYQSPLMAEDHSGLPEAYIFTSQHDLLRDDGYLYAHKLRKDGVKVTHYNCPVCWHGMVDSVLFNDNSRQIMDRFVDYLNENL